jgi:ribosomal protein L11 methylase PrmA
VIANILPIVLVPLAAQLRERLEPDGALLLSGIRDEKRAEVEGAYAAVGLSVTDAVVRAGWHSLRLASDAV